MFWQRGAVRRGFLLGLQSSRTGGAERSGYSPYAKIPPPVQASPHTISPLG